MTKTVAQMALFLGSHSPLKLPINHLLLLPMWVWQRQQLFQLHMCICKWNPNLRELWWLERSLVAWLQMLSRAFNNSAGQWNWKPRLIKSDFKYMSSLWWHVAHNHQHSVEEKTLYKLTKVPGSCISSPCYQSKRELSGPTDQRGIFTNQEW